jgi:hypothetical protein
MSKGHRTALALAAALGWATLGASGCVNEVLVGSQREPVASMDAAQPEPDAQAEPDAGSTQDDAQAELDASMDAAEPIDAGVPIVVETGPFDSGPVYFFDASPPVSLLDAASDDAGCVGSRCPPDAGALGACSSCDAIIFTMLDGACASGLPEVCWQNSDGGCSPQCPDVNTCSATRDCAADEYCYFPNGDCGLAQRGWCSPKPPGPCPLLESDSCGCDGQQYLNGCFAAQAGFSVADIEHARCL